MTTSDTTPNKVHHGRNVKRFRDLFDMKQKALVIELGVGWSQKKVSKLEGN